MLNDNFEMRNEILNILIINIKIIKKYNNYINHCSDIINSLLYCLQDKSSNIRNNTEQFIKLTINLIPRENYIKKIGQFKPSIAENLTNIINNLYEYISNNNNSDKKSLNMERNFSKNRNNKFLSPNKIIINEKENIIKNKDIILRGKMTISTDKKINKKLYYEEKDSKEYTIQKDNKKKRMHPIKTCTTNFYNISKNNKMNSLNNTVENFNNKKNNLNSEHSNLKFNYINNNTNNKMNNSIINVSPKKKLNNNTKNNYSNIIDKINNHNKSSIPNIAKRVNNFYYNSKKEISSIKKDFNNKEQDNKINISNCKNNYKKIFNEINNEDNLTIPMRNRFFSPVISHKSKIIQKDNYKLNDNSLNTTQNLFYKRMISNHYDRKGSLNFTSFNNISKIDNEIKGNLFLKNFKRRKEYKEKRIEEDIKSNFYLEVNNFEKIQKIKEIMKNIFCSSFIEKIFGDNIISIIASINKIKIYIDNNINENIYNIEDNLDIILKVIGYKLSINKSSSLIIETFEMIHSLLISYKKNRLFFNEIESIIILNIFIDNIISNSKAIKEMVHNLLWEVINIIGEEISLYKIIHLIEHKNNKAKNETIDIIIKLYTILLEKGQYHFDNWKIKITKNIIALYFDGDFKNKNKLIFIIKDLYSSFKNDIWKYCKNISSKNRDELMKIIEGNQNNKIYNLDNDYQTFLNNKYDNSNSNIYNYIFNTINKIKKKKDNFRFKKNISKNKELKSNKENLKKIKSNMAYNKNNTKIFENRKYISLNNDDLNNTIHSSQINHLTDNKNNNLKFNKNNSDNKDIIIFGKKNLNNRNNSLKKNLFLNHLNTMENIHDYPKY